MYKERYYDAGDIGKWLSPHDLTRLVVAAELAMTDYDVGAFDLQSSWTRAQVRAKERSKVF